MTAPDDQPPPRLGDRDPAAQPPWDRDRPAAGYPGQDVGYPGQPAGYPGQDVGYPGQPAQPQWGQPGGYPAEPAGYPGQQGGYPGQQASYPGQQVGYPGEPAAPGGPGWPGEAPRKRRRGLKIALLVLAVLAVLCAGGGLLLARPVLKEWPAKLSAPATLAGSPRLSTPELDKAAQDISNDLKKQTRAQDTVAAFYGTRDNPEHVFAIVGVTTLIVDPKKDLADAFAGAGEGMKFTDMRDVDAGPLGGLMHCGASSISSVPLTMCGWADHGSLVLGLFFRSDTDEAAAKLRDIRRTILKR